MLTRRSFFAFSAAASLARHARAADEPLFKPVELNHVALRVFDVEESAEYYQKLFGAPGIIFEKPGQRYMRMGGNFVALFENEEPAMDHFAVSIEDYDADEVEAKLKDRGYETRRSSDFVYVHDPDGIEVQIAHAEHETASPVVREAPEDPILQGKSLQRVSLQIGEQERSVEFYQALFGIEEDREGANGAWFTVGPNQLGLFSGGTVGMSQYTLEVEPYDRRAVSRAMRAGDYRRANNYGKFFAWDPNGHRIEVVSEEE